MSPNTAVRFPSPGIIGQPSPSLLHTSTRPLTPGTYADFDVTALIAQAHRQHEAEKARSHIGAIGDDVGSVINDPAKYRYTGTDHWHTASETAAQPIFGGNQYLNPPASLSAPRSAPLSSSFQPFSDPAPVPQPRQSPNANGHAADVGTTAANHLSALSGLISPLINAGEEVERLKKEVDMWKGEWGRVQKEKRQLEVVVANQEVVKPTGGGFTAVLIDGDGLIFQDHHLQQGFQGGQLAARTLLSALPNLVAHTDSTAHAPDIMVDAAGIVKNEFGESLTSSRSTKERDLGNVVVQIFLNKSGLGSALVKTNTISSYGVYDSFWQGFSAAHDLFTVIDVGAVKEASDAKIREFLKLYVRNAQCETIVLGASHDNGYANVLASLQTESRLSKLFLLKGYSELAAQLRRYSSRVVSIPDLFRTNKIPAAPTSFSAIVQQNASPTTRSAPARVAPIAEASSPRSTVSSLSVEVIEWGSTPEDAEAKKVTDKQRVKAVTNNKAEKDKGKSDGEWTEAKKGGKKYKGKGTGVTGTTVRSLKPRPCHTFYLSEWGCNAGDECDYAHHYKLSPAQREELADLAKQMLCPFVLNNRCRFSDEDCVYGHQCPRMDDCIFGDTCRFSVLPNGHGELDDVDSVGQGIKGLRVK